MNIKKKWIIGLSVSLGIIVILIILIFTLFSLSKVELDYRTSITNLTASEEEIISSANFNYSSTVLFAKKSKYINRLEKNNPYLKVINIETVFPNKFVIHIKERQELFAIESEDGFLICDEEFKVLKVQEEFASEKNNAVLLKGVTYSNSSATAGDFLDINYSILKEFYSLNLLNNRSYKEILSNYKEIELFACQNELTNAVELGINFSTFEGQKVQINNIEFGFLYKIQKFYSVYSTLYENIGVEDSEGHIWTLEDLSNNIIYINNYIITDLTSRNETDVYFKLIKETESLA